MRNEDRQPRWSALTDPEKQSIFDETKTLLVDAETLRLKLANDAPPKKAAIQN